MNNNVINVAFASKMLVIATMIAVTMTASLVMAHDGHVGDDHDVVTGTITVKKVIVGETDAVVGDFSFSINGGLATNFNPSANSEGSKTEGVAIADAPFTIVEVEANGEGYVTTYDNCANILAGETCVITNTFETVVENASSTETDDTETENATSTEEVEESESTGTSTNPIETTEDTEEDSYVEVSNEQCEIEGHKYDQTGNPLSDWVIGLMKTVTQGDKQDIYDLDKDTTDADGYYCLNWDGETREFRGDGEPQIKEGEFSLFYSIYEILKDGWLYNSIEKGADHSNLEVVADSEVKFDGDYRSTQIGEVDGYIYTDAAYHVDFYNKLIEEEKEDEVVEEGSSRSSGGGGGTRVGDRDKNRSNNSSTTDEDELSTPEPTPIVLGEQVSVVPTGAPNAGVGGANNTLTFEQMLFVSERLQLVK